MELSQPPHQHQREPGAARRKTATPIHARRPHGVCAANSALRFVISSLCARAVPPPTRATQASAAAGHGAGIEPLVFYLTLLQQRLVAQSPNAIAIVVVFCRGWYWHPRPPLHRVEAVHEELVEPRDEVV